MKKLALAVALLSLYGCQAMPNSLSKLPADIKRISTSAFSGFSPTYYGRELPPSHMTDHNLDVSNGHEFRGYDFGPRHYFQHSR